SLDDLANVGSDKVSQFAAGALKFLSGQGLPGKLGNIVKTADEVCSGADKGISGKKLLADAAMLLSGQKTDCATKLIEAFNARVSRPSALAPRPAAAATPTIGVLGIASSWAFDNPVPKGAGFQATLTLNYSSDQLPDHPDFDETQLRVVSYDPTAGVAEILPTHLDPTAKTAPARLPPLAPPYSLAMVGPLSKSLLRSPLLLSGGNLSSGLALDSLGSSTANGALAAFAADGTPLPGAPTLPIAPNAQ